MKRSTLILIFLWGVLATSAFAQVQSFNNFAKAGEEAYESGDFFNAFQYLTAALEYDPDHPALWYLAGESAYEYGIYEKAAATYLKALSFGHQADFTNIYYHLGNVYLGLGDYEQAEVYYDLSQEHRDSEPNWNEAVWQSENLPKAKLDRDTFAARNQNLVESVTTGINTSYSEFGFIKRPGATADQDTIYYTSFNGYFKKDTERPRRKLMRIYRKVGNGVAEPMPETVNEPELHAANVAFTSTGRLVFFNKCEYVGLEEVRCDLYCAFVGKDGSWRQIQKLDINRDDVTTQDPAIGLLRNPTSGQDIEYLFFASDRGEGDDLDLYRCTVDAGTGRLGIPEPLTDLNTGGDERSPFFVSEEQALYYSTNGEFTYGGYDIYRSDYLNGIFTKSYNVGFPISSAFNDLHFTQSGGLGGKMYFSSNRPAGNKLFYRQDSIVLASVQNIIYEVDDSLNYCCNDIFAFTPPPIRLIVETYDSMFSPLQPLPYTLSDVQLYDLTAEPATLVAPYDSTGNAVFYDLKRGRNYEVQGAAPGYRLNPTVQADSNFRVTTALIPADTLLRRMIPFTQQLQIDVLDFCNQAPIDATVEVYEFSYATGPGEKLVSKQGDYGNHFEYDIPLNPEYGFLAVTSKEGYITSTDTLTFDQGTLVEFNGVLPFEVSLAYDRTPQELFLYFDNGIPRGNPQYETNVRFDAVNEIYGQQRAEYISKIDVLTDLSPNDTFLLKQYTRTFFDEQIRTRTKELQTFFDDLNIHLTNNKEIDLSITGFASPLAASSSYDNTALSSRRIWSVINFMNAYASSKSYDFSEGNPLLSRKTNAQGVLDTPQAATMAFITGGNLPNQGKTDWKNGNRAITHFGLEAALLRSVAIRMEIKKCREDLSLNSRIRTPK